jgi:hypothetical protein
MVMPLPKLRNPTVSGNRPASHPLFGHTGRVEQRKNDRNLHRGPQGMGRHRRRKPWWVPQWIWEQEMEDLEAMAYDQSILASQGTAPMAGNPGDSDQLELPPDESNDYTNALQAGNPNFPQDQGKKKKHKHDKHKRRPNDNMFQSRGYNHLSTKQGQDTGMQGGGSDIDNSQGYGGNGNGQSPFSTGQMAGSSSSNSYGGLGGMDMGGLQQDQNSPDNSSDWQYSEDIEQQGPYDDSPVGYSYSASGQGSPYTSLSDPDDQFNPWGYGSG